ncbi:MAG TPA: two-component regulator propeller domain-containing protein [Bryobacteraceae bacterium]|nr:two-component regulator propeller domain-containing protein [Bryobacteraceae bacterium]
MRVCVHSRVLWLELLSTCWSLHGAQLPLRHYTTADGLANNMVLSIASDPRGFLWFGTAEGLSRFDGYGFANQTEGTGLPHGSVRQVLIGRHGNYWLATSAGLVRFRPDLPQSNADRMIVIRPNGKPEAARISVLLEDRGGTLWCGTEAGLYTIDDTASRTPRLAEAPIGLPGAAWDDSEVRGLAEDAEGAVWIGVTDGTLYRRLPDGRVESYNSAGGRTSTEIFCLRADRKGRIWVGRVGGLYRSAPAPHPGGNGFESLSGREGLPRIRVFDIFESREGDVWVGMYQYLAQFPADGAPARVWTKNSGLPSKGAFSLGQDRDGNLWLGTDDLGAFKLAAGGNLTYSTGDGIGMDGVISVAETLRGELFMAGSKESGGFPVGFRSGAGFRAVAPRVPKSITSLGWRPGRRILQDRQGEWWLASSQGLCRYPRLDSPSQLAQTAPKALYTTRDGLSSDEVVRLYEDRGGNIWVGTETAKFAYWSRREQKLVGIASDGLPDYASAFGEDSAGHVWIGGYSGQLWRVQDGHASLVRGPTWSGSIRDFLLDHAGRVWVATGGQGLLRYDQAAGPNPQFRQYGYSDGLSSLNLYSLAEDRNGAIYIGTGGGVDRLDPDLAHIRHYTPADGIAPGEVFAAYRDRTGAIWFGTGHGLTRLVPQKGPASDPPTVWITGLSIAGRPALVSEAGESSMRGVEVKPGQEHVQFDFVGLSYSPGNLLRYQYRLGDDAWSAPIESRSVHYGALAPGQYRFAVRAINSDGEASPVPATVEFRVSPPVWQRAWFQGILLAVAIAGAVWVHRARVARLLEIERVRTRIATDLHDDIGSSLSQIAILSEVAHQRAAGGKAGEPMERIGALSRELLDSISDIVWAIQPHKDHLSDLKQRMRRFAADVLSARNVEMHWSVSDSGRDFELNSELRRQVYLIFKESINNIARHSRATEARIALRVVERQLALEVSDNGCGIRRRERPDGNGLESMRLRASRLGGELEVRSAEGQGTTVLLRAPLPA